MGYPAEIYISTARGEEITDPAARVDREKAYNIGKTDSESLDGWSKLTQAIQDDLNIDWEKLDQSQAKCLHPYSVSLTYKLERNDQFNKRSCYGWLADTCPDFWETIFIDAWRGRNGCSLYIKGEIPLKRKTADQLPAGMCFEGKKPGSRYEHRAVIADFHDGKGVFIADTPGIHDPKKITVIKEYGIGTFKETA